MNLISKCQICDTSKEYSLEFDAIYCSQCNIWLENRCNDKECEYCNLRPETPDGKSDYK